MKNPEKIRVIDSIPTLEALIREFEESGREFLFRGTSDRYSMKVRIDKLSGKAMEDEINSFLYRSLRDKVPFSETFCPFHIEGEMLHAIWEEHPDLPRNREELLTDLQHHFDETNVIDFTNKLRIAGFFVGRGNNKEDAGEILVIDRAKIKNEIPETLSYASDEPFIVKAVKTDLSQEIVKFQGSVFIYPPAGYISKDLCHEIIQVPANIKQDILDYLDKHGINEDTVFAGRSDELLTKKFSIETASVQFHLGFALLKKGEYKESIVPFDMAINPNNLYSLPDAHNGRGVAKYHLGKDQEAMDDYNKAIELKDDFASAYNNRGLVKSQPGHYQEAIADFDIAIKLKSRDAKFYHNRGRAKYELEFSQSNNLISAFMSATADLNKAMELDPDHASSRNLHWYPTRQIFERFNKDLQNRIEASMKGIPSGARQHGHCKGDVVVSWNTIPEATGYELEVTITDDPDFSDRTEIVGGPTDSLTSKTFTGATFSFRVRSVRSISGSITRSPWSDRF